MDKVLNQPFRLRTVPKGTEPKNYSAPAHLRTADLQLKHMKQRLIITGKPVETVLSS
ncbi:uncharacterized protein Nmag_3627 (plasmid) [Natrialba magadii ATCC 43099]|uniref:Uncharacterized protein n=1 Tax=Natrialba magadii (strain ATCC 43099 / DSM 3394 / CCM 3739 / CIP 104546 / IAM 13178 / JCM 8861 / NBRC 102185 / NCIMB 2190 / MS3) TaxID=547559 RepID=D3T0R7_NATMM|nr:uncharacterized protein Nmag_3627 [Natrialba magadii ATCC 43099]